MGSCFSRRARRTTEQKMLEIANILRSEYIAGEKAVLAAIREIVHQQITTKNMTIFVTPVANVRTLPNSV